MKKETNKYKNNTVIQQNSMKFDEIRHSVQKR